MSDNPWLAATGGTAGPGYAARFAALAARGVDVDGEARRVHALVSARAPEGASVLDAGCGTGRVAIALAALGHDVVGVDLDASMLEEARRAAPGLAWVLGDLADLDLGRRVDAVVAAGNLWPFLTPGSHRRVVTRLAAHLRPGGVLVAGFGLDPAHVPTELPSGLAVPGLDVWDAACLEAGLVLLERTADWEGTRDYAGGGYVVTVHRAAPGDRRR